MKSQTNRGLILVFTGEGKGKTTAAFGLALRAAGQGMRVLILQFMKGQTNVGEIKALAKTQLPITLKQFGRPGFVQTRVCEPLDMFLAHQGLEALQKAFADQAYELIILDEINLAVDFGLLKIEELTRVIEKKPPKLHLVLTGRYTKREILKIADLVTEMKEVKHHYHQGIKGQKGIEF